MTTAQRLRNLTVPTAPVDVVLGKTPMPTYDHLYAFSPDSALMEYVYDIHRDALRADVIEKLTRS